MRDTLKNTKDTLRNFVAWLSGRDLPTDQRKIDALLEEFLVTQVAGEVRFVECCGHCGSDNVVASDFSAQPAPSHLPAHIRAEWKPGSGPSWACNAKDCGHHTERIP